MLFRSGTHPVQMHWRDSLQAAIGRTLVFHSIRRQISAGGAKQKLLQSQIFPARRSPKYIYFFDALADAPRWAEPNLTEANASSTVRRGKKLPVSFSRTVEVVINSDHLHTVYGACCAPGPMPKAAGQMCNCDLRRVHFGTAHSARPLPQIQCKREPGQARS